MNNKSELKILWGLVRRVNNMIYGYEKPKGRPRGKAKNKNKSS